VNRRKDGRKRVRTIAQDATWLPADSGAPATSCSTDRWRSSAPASGDCAARFLSTALVSRCETDRAAGDRDRRCCAVEAVPHGGNLGAACEDCGQSRGERKPPWPPTMWARENSSGPDYQIRPSDANSFTARASTPLSVESIRDGGGLACAHMVDSVGRPGNRLRTDIAPGDRREQRGSAMTLTMLFEAEPE